MDREETRTAWAIDDYADEGIREHAWFISGVRRYHRPLSTFLNGLIDAGFRVERVVEPTPSAAWLRDRPGDADESRRPLFLLVRARLA